MRRVKHLYTNTQFFTYFFVWKGLRRIACVCSGQNVPGTLMMLFVLPLELCSAHGKSMSSCSLLKHFFSVESAIITEDPAFIVPFASQRQSSGTRMTARSTVTGRHATWRRGTTCSRWWTARRRCSWTRPSVRCVRYPRVPETPLQRLTNIRSWISNGDQNLTISETWIRSTSKYNKIRRYRMSVSGLHTNNYKLIWLTPFLP